jgi:hypothetical protein
MLMARNQRASFESPPRATSRGRPLSDVARQTIGIASRAGSGKAAAYRSQLLGQRASREGVCLREHPSDSGGSHPPDRPLGPQNYCCNPDVGRHESSSHCYVRAVWLYRRRAKTSSSSSVDVAAAGGGGFSSFPSHRTHTHRGQGEVAERDEAAAGRLQPGRERARVCGLLGEICVCACGRGSCPTTAVGREPPPQARICAATAAALRSPSFSLSYFFTSSRIEKLLRNGKFAHLL